MNLSRRTFGKRAAQFVAGIALGIGVSVVQPEKKIIETRIVHQRVKPGLWVESIFVDGELKVRVPCPEMAPEGSKVIQIERTVEMEIYV